MTHSFQQNILRSGIEEDELRLQSSTFPDMKLGQVTFVWTTFSLPI